MDSDEMFAKYQLVEMLGTTTEKQIWLGVAPDKTNVYMVIVEKRHLAVSIDKIRQTALSISLLQHKNIAQFREIEETDLQIAVVYEYRTGVLLSELKQADTIPIFQINPSQLNTNQSYIIGRETGGKSNDLLLDVTLPLLRKICEAVAYAHENSVVIGNITPANILILPDGEPLLIAFADYALGVSASSTSINSMSNHIIATPEVIKNKRMPDEKSDIYSLGLLAQFLGIGARRFLVQTILNIKKPSEQISWELGKSLCSIAYHAMARNPEKRYQSVQQIVADLTTIDQSNCCEIKQLKRRKLATLKIIGVLGVILLLLITATGMGRFNKPSPTFTWNKIYGSNFTTGPYSPSDFIFLDASGVETNGWNTDTAGLKITHRGWCWLRNIRVTNDVRLEITFRYDSDPDGFEIMINAEDSLITLVHQAPRGYGAQIGGYGSAIDFVNVHKQGKSMLFMEKCAVSQAEIGQELKVCFQRVDTTIELFINNKKSLTIIDKMPFLGSDFSRIGFHSYSSDVHVKKIEIFSLKHHGSSNDPLSRANSYVAHGNYSDATNAFFAIAHKYPKTHFESRALLGAFHAVRLMEVPNKVLLFDSIVAIANKRPENDEIIKTIAEYRMLYSWGEGNYEEVLLDLPGLIKRWPESTIGFELNKIKNVPTTYKAMLLPYMESSAGITALDISYMNLTSLPELLSSQSLLVLKADGNKISNISGLKFDRLRYANVSNNQLESVEALQGSGLLYFDCGRNSVVTLEPLKDAPLLAIHASFNKIEKLTAFSSKRLKKLELDHNKIESLEPLRELSLKWLRCEGNKIESLEPIANHPIEYLHCGRNDITDLSPVKKMPLRYLSCGYNPSLLQLTSLSEMSLTTLQCNGLKLDNLIGLESQPLQILEAAENNISDLSPLQGKRLISLNVESNAIKSLEPISQMQLQTLYVSNNPISTLQPLKDMKLRNLEIQFLPLSSLDPMVENPPDEFLFYSPHITAVEYDRVASIWEKNIENKRFATYARIYKAINNGDIKTLKRYGIEFDGKVYLHIPIRTSLIGAKEICSKIKGRLPTITSTKELRVLATNFINDNPAWIDKPDVNGLYSSTGEKADFIGSRINYPLGGGWKMRINEVVIEEPIEGARATIMVEWDK